MRLTILFIYFLLLNLLGFSQNVDSLLLEINKTNDDNKLALLHEECGMYYDTLDREKSIFHRRESAHYYDKIGNLNEVAIKYVNIAEHFNSLSQMDSAVKYYEKSIEIIPKLDSMWSEPMVYLNLANILSYSGENMRAISLIDECILTLATHPNDSILIAAKMQKAREYRRMADYETALKLYDSTLVLGKAFGSPELISQLYNNISVVYQGLEQYRTALKYLDSAELYTVNPSTQVKFVSNHNRGRNFLKLSEYSIAQKHFLYCEQLLLNDSLEQIWKNLYFREVYNNLAEVSEKKKDFETAVFYLKKMNDYAKKISDENNQKEIFRLSEQFESEKKKQEIEALKKINLEKDKLHTAETTRNWIITGFVISILLIILGSILIYNRNRRKVNQSEKEVLKKNALLEGQKNERKRLSQDLHDGLGSTLAAIKLRLESNGQIDKETLSAISRACDETRTISHALSGKNTTSFVKEIKKIYAPFKDQFKISFDPFPKPDLEKIDVSIQSDVLFIIKECLNNAFKYSKAEKIEIHLFIEENNLMLLFEDNGIGMEPEKSNGIGISNIKNRVNRYKGTFFIESKINLGTSYHISIPLI